MASINSIVEDLTTASNTTATNTIYITPGAASIPATITTTNSGPYYQSTWDISESRQKYHAIFKDVCVNDTIAVIPTYVSAGKFSIKQILLNCKSPKIKYIEGGTNIYVHERVLDALGVFLSGGQDDKYGTLGPSEFLDAVFEE